MENEPIVVNTAELPATIRDAEALFMEHDRRFFEDHPKRTNFVRTVYPGEFPQFDFEFVHVIHMGKGLRARIPIPDRTTLSEQARANGMSVREYVRAQFQASSSMQFNSKQEAVSFMTGYKNN